MIRMCALLFTVEPQITRVIEGEGPQIDENERLSCQKEEAEMHNLMEETSYK